MFDGGANIIRTQIIFNGTMSVQTSQVKVFFNPCEYLVTKCRDTIPIYDICARHAIMKIHIRHLNAREKEFGPCQQARKDTQLVWIELPPWPHVHVLREGKVIFAFHAGRERS